MVSEIVVDTNIFVHANRPDQETSRLFSEALEFVLLLEQNSVCLCVDEGFSLAESENGSRIGYEYLEYIRYGSVSMEMINMLASKARIIAKSSRVDNRERGIIRQEIHDVSDQVFVRVTWNTDDHILVSHDWTHFSEETRKSLKKQLGLELINAQDCCVLFEG